VGFGLIFLVQPVLKALGIEVPLAGIQNPALAGDAHGIDLSMCW
jgi:hypothetical protein